MLAFIVAPTIDTITTGIKYLTTSGLDPTDKALRVSQVAVFVAGFAIYTTTTFATSLATVGVNVAFLAYMLKILEASNNSNIPFILPFKDGQGKVILLMVVTCGLIYILVYAIKQYLKLCKSFYKFAHRSAGRIFTKSPKVPFIPVK